MRTFVQTWTGGLVLAVGIAASLAAVGGLVLFALAGIIGFEQAPLWTAYSAIVWAPLSVGIALRHMDAKVLLGSA